MAETKAKEKPTRVKLPVGTDGLVPIQFSVNGAPPVRTRSVFSPWSRLWQEFETLEIATEDTTVGKQKVKAGFSPWAFVALEGRDVIASARSSLNSYANRQGEYRVDIQPDPKGLWVRKVARDKWSERLKS